MTYFTYFSEIEETFCRRRGRQLFLGPRDWALMANWEERGIPVHIVTRAINDIFDAREKKPGPQRTISSLSYCRHEVEAAYTEWQQSQVGAGEPAAAIDDGWAVERVREYLLATIETLSAVGRGDLKPAVDHARRRLAGLGTRVTTDFEAIDNELNEIERDLDFAVITTVRGKEVEQIELEIAAQMEPYRDKMQPGDFENTYSLMLLKRVREVTGIPRLSLFSM